MSLPHATVRANGTFRFGSPTMEKSLSPGVGSTRSLTPIPVRLPAMASAVFTCWGRSNTSASRPSHTTASHIPSWSVSYLDRAISRRAAAGSAYAGRRGSVLARHDGLRTRIRDLPGTYPDTTEEEDSRSEPSIMYGPEETRNGPYPSSWPVATPNGAEGSAGSGGTGAVAARE